ncbi:reverse transcriptase domain-containing protein [Candidatus Phytoplasma gossypii]|uniref:Reverse transcriptase domain-containing protein n=1 Tax=Candidatus Phytoplasma gossypii TaxID=2982629 RepID=A0ABT9D0L8_9MOLU|nr:reverse transcriptase domain-containing protein ['Gossypium sp.' phytoplasma]
MVKNPNQLKEFSFLAIIKEPNPLELPTIKDRLMQKCLEQLLALYFENIFSAWNLGFRTKKSCHDAIKRVKPRFQGIDYIIKIDLKGYFDTINHEILMRTLNQFIKKNKTLSTICK